MKKRVPIILILLLAAGLAGRWLYVHQVKASKNSALELHGNVDIREVNVGFRVAGRLIDVLFDEGDEVKTGELLARLDDEPYRREVEESRAQAASSRSRLQLVQAGNRPQEIAQAKASLHEREVALANAERLYRRQEELFSSKTVSVQERDDAEANFREAEARRNSAREQLSLLQAGFRAEDIAQAQADLARAEAALATSELRLKDTELKAPADGVILTRAQEPGAILETGATVMTISLQSPVWVRAYIPESDLGRIHPGLQVQVYTDSAPNKPYTGKIGYISPRAEFTPKNVETSELRTSLVYRLRIVVENPDNGLRQGMPVTARLVR